jgi:hypothetical protein
MTIYKRKVKPMPNENKLDRRRKYYFVLDCETATLPYAHEFTGE